MDQDIRELAIAHTKIILRDAAKRGLPGAVSLAQIVRDADYYPALCEEACAHIATDAAMLGDAKLARHATMVHMAWLMLYRGRVSAAHGYLHSV
jgi:hypothetical protein